MTSPPISPVSNFYEFKCHSCNINIIIEHDQLNCRIFRCGIIKSSGEPIPPHSSKLVCDELRDNNLIIGCGLPFKINDDMQLVSCDYI